MNKLTTLEHNQQRVLTTAQLAKCYETDTQKITQNFNNNKERYIPGKHFFLLQGEALQAFKGNIENFDVADNVGRLYLSLSGKIEDALRVADKLLNRKEEAAWQ